MTSLHPAGDRRVGIRVLKSKCVCEKNSEFSPEKIVRTSSH